MTQPEDATPALGPALERLAGVVHAMRMPGGCAWHGELTHASLVEYLVEETYELVEAIEQGSPAALREELGDLLYQVVLHAEIAGEHPDDGVDLVTVVEALSDKLIRRHPHVFGDAGQKTVDELEREWEGVKATTSSTRRGPFDGVPDAMPALALARKLLERGRRAGVQGPPVRVPSPMVEPTDEDALGDALLALAASGHRRGLDPERALRAALRRYRADVEAAVPNE